MSDRIGESRLCAIEDGIHMEGLKGDNASLILDLIEGVRAAEKALKLVERELTKRAVAAELRANAAEDNVREAWDILRDSFEEAVEPKDYKAWEYRAIEWLRAHRLCST